MSNNSQFAVRTKGYRINMEVTFDKIYLKELYELGETDDKKHRFQPEIIRKYIRVIDLMISQPDTMALLKYNALNYEQLKGNKIGLSSELALLIEAALGLDAIPLLQMQARYNIIIAKRNNIFIEKLKKVYLKKEKLLRVLL